MLVLIEAWETWEHNAPVYYKAVVMDEQEAHAAGLEYAMSLLDKYENDLRALARYEVSHAYYDYEQRYHDLVMEHAHYNIWRLMA